MKKARSKSVTKSAETGRINDVIFKELIKRGHSNEGKTHVWNIADSKLWYLTPKQAQSFLDLERSKDYQKDVIQKEVDLIRGNIKEVLITVGTGPLNIIDLGCGDGKKAALFVEQLKGKVKLRYCPIDISGYMVEKAIKTMRNLNAGEVVQFQWNISDFENLENVSALLRQEEYKKNFILLLGNTLGNFEINELLYTVRSSMREGDLLLIGNGLDNRHKDELTKSYNNDAVNNFQINVPFQIGLTEKDIEFGVRFRNSRIEILYTLKKDKKITFQNKTIEFNRGDKIITAISYKYDKYDFMAFMKMYFEDVKMYVSPDEMYALVLCKK
ncbi:MAG: L-histidine N(alpha)-methyltransferase [Candidatus Pacearchaeota archaeon]|jgi:uncharacterized SAM-dependent methyltransferase